MVFSHTSAVIYTILLYFGRLEQVKVVLLGATFDTLSTTFYASILREREKASVKRSLSQ